MQRTIAVLGLGCLLLAGCASGPEDEATARREEGYVPTGSNIPRRDPKRADIPAATSGQLDTLSRGSLGPAGSRAN